MPIFNAIAAMSENRVIGIQGKIPWHIPEDFRWFKHKTMGGTLIMGRKTFDSIGKPLPGRKMIVLTRHSLDIPNVEISTDANALIKKLSDQVSSQPERIVPWICGGAEIYRQCLPKCLTLYLTRVKRIVEGDAFFPEFENNFDLEQVIHENLEFRIERWVRKDWPHDASQEAWPFSSQEE